MFKYKLKTLFLVLMVITRPISCEPLKENQECIEMVQSWLSSMVDPKEESPEAFAWFSTIPHMRFNCILRFSYANDIEAHLDSLIGKAPSNVPIAFWMDQKDSTPELIQALKNRNFVSAGFYPAMSWDVTSVEAPELEVQPADIELFHEILATCLHYNEGVKQGSLNLLRDKGGEHFIVYLEGKPVGTGTLFAKGEIGAVFHVATLPEYQKRGVGRAMMQFIMNKASEKGLKKLVLHSSHVAEKLYHSLGFQKIDDVEIYYREP